MVDAGGFTRATKAVAIGLPVLLTANAKAKLALKSATAFAGSAPDAVKGMGSLAKELGAQNGLCIGNRLNVAARGAVQAKASICVSVQASASVSGSATAH